jgi:hypothetical protein
MWLAGQCRGWADELTIPDAPAVGPSQQASAAAVRAVHAVVAAAGDTLGIRMHTTAARLATLATGYRDQDASAATDLGSAGAAVTV